MQDKWHAKDGKIVTTKEIAEWYINEHTIDEICPWCGEYMPSPPQKIDIKDIQPNPHRVKEDN